MVGTLHLMTDPADALSELDLQLILSPDDRDLLFRRAYLLEAAGRLEDAKAAYYALLRRNPRHPSGLNNLGRLLYRQGARRAARFVFERALEHDAQNAAAHANLGILFLELDELAKARLHFQAALNIDPAETLAHFGLSRVFAIEGDDAAALRHQRSAFGSASSAVFAQASPPRRSPRLLLLASEEQLGAVQAQRLADATFCVTTLLVERFDLRTPLPAHHLIFNTIGDADRNARALEAAREIVRASRGHVLNDPAAVLQTARIVLPQHLGEIENVIVPRVACFSRATLASGEGMEQLRARDVECPLLLRAPGYHSGQHFVRVEAPSTLSSAVSLLPGDDVLAIEYVNTRSPDGTFRKYRAMIVDGELFPLHLAVSNDWKVHFFSADMATNPEHRAEDATFLNDMDAALGRSAAEALRAIAARLGLDYAGIDFALDARGRIVVFEANATMTVPPPAAGAIWDYRRAPVKRILDATRRMLLRRSRAGGWS